MPSGLACLEALRAFLEPCILGPILGSCILMFRCLVWVVAAQMLSITWLMQASRVWSSG